MYNRQIDTARVEASVLKTAIMTGRTEGLSLAARNMLKEGMSPDSIAKITGLSVDAILKLKDG